MNTPLSRTARRWILGTLVVGLAVIGGLIWASVTHDRAPHPTVGPGELARSAAGEQEQTPAPRDRDVAGLRDAGVSLPPRLVQGLPKPQAAAGNPAPVLGPAGTDLPAIRDELRIQALQHALAPAPGRVPVSAEQAQKLRDELRAQGTLPLTIRMPSLGEVRQATPGEPQFSSGTRTK